MKANDQTYILRQSLWRFEQKRGSGGHSKSFHVARRDIENLQEISVSENYVTYLIRFIRDETRGMDLRLGTIIS